MCIRDSINAGVAKLVITASGTHYAGTKELSFQILRKSIHLCDIGSIQTQVYTESDIKPTVTVEDDGKALELLSDYTPVSYTHLICSHPSLMRIMMYR